MTLHHCPFWIFSVFPFTTNIIQAFRFEGNRSKCALVQKWLVTLYDVMERSYTCLFSAASLVNTSSLQNILKLDVALAK